MSGEPITTFVATLLYREAMAGGFAQIVAEFNEAFRNRPQLPYSFGRPYDDFAVFDIEGAHIVIAHGDTAETGQQRQSGDRAVIALAISAATGDEPALAPRLQRLLRSIVARIQRPYPAEAVLWSTHEGSFEPDTFDALVSEAEATGAAKLAEPASANPAAEAPLADPAPRPQHPDPRGPGSTRMPRPCNRFAPVDEVVGSLNHPMPMPATDAKPAAATDEVANTLPDIPSPMLAEAARIRLALYPEPEILAPQKAPTPQRLTIYTLNTALILVAMPVGVAVLTYNVLGRESMATTARSVALAGFGVAFAHTTAIGQVLLTFI